MCSDKEERDDREEHAEERPQSFDEDLCVFLLVPATEEEDDWELKRVQSFEELKRAH